MGAPPSFSSEHEFGRRLFKNGKSDRHGYARLPDASANPAKPVTVDHNSTSCERDPESKVKLVPKPRPVFRKHTLADDQESDSSDDHSSPAGRPLHRPRTGGNDTTFRSVDITIPTTPVRSVPKPLVDDHADLVMISESSDHELGAGKRGPSRKRKAQREDSDSDVGNTGTLDKGKSRAHDVGFNSHLLAEAFHGGRASPNTEVCLRLVTYSFDLLISH